ncbi:tumor necrosis factor receptor superfamily member 6 isoform X2 [Gadus morhua]|uniref:tumor necrosis factor receptor superfamily member 6 isoform X1 n=2 Tax=Gadus morhua TaxID=8049 RepID=UPI0011B695FB|nr:tumor necrosis factor receptor superfamily member 6-like isoform X1 [Gadus morhua]XP_030227396.1 tumor necrosis factor receptor superfamily member 6-like isoform X2 [Gadus morhua]
MAQLSYFVTIISLSNLLLLFCDDSLNCSDKEYAWPMDTSQRCCLRCPPGKFLLARCSSSSNETGCKSCPTGQYTDSFNLEPSCPFCDSCDNSSRLEEESSCQIISNTKCRCQLGFTCKSKECQECETIPNSTPPTPNLWSLVNGWTLLATGLLLLVFLCYFLRIKIKSGASLCKSTGHDAIESAEEENEFLPVQEMCGKHEQQMVDV